jgi:transposase
MALFACRPRRAPRALANRVRARPVGAGLADRVSGRGHSYHERGRRGQYVSARDGGLSAVDAVGLRGARRGAGRAGAGCSRRRSRAPVPERRAAAYSGPHCDVVRAKAILHAAASRSNSEIAERLDVSRQAVSEWQKRLSEEAGRGLRPPPIGPSAAFPQEQVAEVKALACELPAEEGQSALTVVERCDRPRGDRAGHSSADLRHHGLALAPRGCDPGLELPVLDVSGATPTSATRPVSCSTSTVHQAFGDRTRARAAPAGSGAAGGSAPKRGAASATSTREHPGPAPGDQASL